MIVALPTIDVQRATTRIVRALAPVAFHNHRQAIRVTLHCLTVPPTTRLRCTFNVYGEHRLIERVVLTVKPVKRHPQVVRPDLSGYVTYSSGRSLRVVPR